MDYIDQIEIKINSLNNKIVLFIVPSDLKVYVHDKVKTIKKVEIKKLLDIICKWDYEYINNSVIDGQSFMVSVYSSEGVDNYFGSGKYPSNYNEFLEFVRSFYE